MDEFIELAKQSMVSRCTATAHSTGKQCGRDAIPGGNVCRRHGGLAPQTIAAARRVLDSLREPAIAALDDFLDAQPRCEVCGRSDDPALRLQASKIVLDRTGFGPHATLAVVTPDDPYAHATTDELIAKLESMLKHVYELRDSEQQQLAGVIEGVVAVDPDEREI